MATDYADVLVMQIAAVCVTACAPAGGKAVGGAR
jgi:hypothetical protein